MTIQIPDLTPYDLAALDTLCTLPEGADNVCLAMEIWRSGELADDEIFGFAVYMRSVQLDQADFWCGGNRAPFVVAAAAQGQTPWPA